MSSTVIEHEDCERVSIVSQGRLNRCDDRIHKWSVWGIVEYIHNVNAWLMENGHKKFMDLNGLAAYFNNEVTITIIKSVIYVSPSAYNYNLLSDPQLKYTTEVEEVRPKWFAVRQLLIDNISKKVLAERLIKGCLFNIVTRRHVKFPDWYLKMFAHLKKKDPSALSRSLISLIPDGCHRFDTTIRFSDTDSTKHTNNTTYIKLCMDAASVAATSGHFVHFNDDMCTYPLKTVELNFLAETRAGDKITIYVWQDKNTTSKIHFQILQSSKPVMYSLFEFSLKKIQLVSKM